MKYDPKPTGETTKEGVAFQLMVLIAQAEGVSFGHKSTFAVREWVLRTYRDCLMIVSGGAWNGTADGIPLPPSDPQKAELTREHQIHSSGGTSLST